MTPFCGLMAVFANNPIYRDQPCPFGRMTSANTGIEQQNYSWKQSAIDFKTIAITRQWCWTTFCASWFMLGWALIVGKE